MYRTRLRGERLSLTPWARDALTLEDKRDLTIRAEELRIRVGVGGSHSTGPWTVRVTSEAKVGGDGPYRFDSVHRLERYHVRGRLADVLHSIFDRYATEYVYSPDELVTIFAQSGTEMRRA